jgi:hypothetical protein
MAKKKRTRRPAVRRLPDRAPSPTLVTPEGDPLVFCTALYRHPSMDQVVQILAQADDFDLEGPSPGPGGTLQFAWYEVGPGKPPLPAPMERRVLAAITLARETLQVETTSEQRLARCHLRLERLLGSRLPLLHKETKSLEQALAEERPQDVPEPAILPPEAIADMQERMLRQWIDESIPALDGMTPREAVQTPEGRQMVLDLIDYIEGQQALYPPPPGMFTADYREALKLLGLE